MVLALGYLQYCSISFIHLERLNFNKEVTYFMDRTMHSSLGQFGGGFLSHRVLCYNIFLSHLIVPSGTAKIATGRNSSSQSFPK